MANNKQNATKYQYLEKVADLQELKPGDIIRRVSAEKKQQGQFSAFGETKNDLILLNVIDLANSTLAAEAGILRISSDDQIFRHKYQFGNDYESRIALEIIEQWTLYQKHPELKEAIFSLIKSSFSPLHILELKEQDQLKTVFVPVQERLKIGKYVQKVDPDKAREELFRQRLEEIAVGEHITYITFIPEDKLKKSLFYSIGTKPHQVTEMQLHNEIFNFEPNYGGHIKLVSIKDGVKQFWVDAGSNYLGQGTKTPIRIAKMAASNLKRQFKQHIFIAKPGREAFSELQSY